MRQHGAILLETLIAMALFTGAAAFSLVATRQVFDGLDKARRTQQALDIVRSKLAELEAGLISLSELRTGEEVDAVGSLEGSFAEDGGESSGFMNSGNGDSGGGRWVFGIQTQRTAFNGLSLVQLTVREESERPDRVWVTMRQLLPLSEEEVAQYEVDELIEDLPPPEEIPNDVPEDSPEDMPGDDFSSPFGEPEDES